MKTLFKATLQEVIDSDYPDPDKELYCINLYFGSRKSTVMRFPIIFNGLENAQPVFQELLEHGGKSESELKEIGKTLYKKYKHLDVRNKPAATQGKLYYIQNTNAGYLGNSIYFWALNSAGYTAKLENAQKYTFEEAKKICAGNPHRNKAWPVDYIDNNKGTARVTDSQYLEPENIVDFSTTKHP